jgi:hypothetical protein
MEVVRAKCSMSFGMYALKRNDDRDHGYFTSLLDLYYLS